MRVRPSHEEDAAFIERLFSLHHVATYLNAPTRDQIVRSINGSGENFIVDVDGEAAGNVLLRRNGFLADVAILAVARPGCGVGTFALRWALEQAFKQWRVHRVFLETREDNEAMCGLAERFGFVREGVYRDGFQDERTGRYFNLCPYGLLEDEYSARAASNRDRIPSPSTTDHRGEAREPSSGS